MPTPNRQSASPRQAGGFLSTRWSIVVSAGRRSSPDSRRALESLCETYWLPLYAFARRRVASVEEAQDLTQEFFVRLLEKQVLAEASPERGRFRSFLLTAMKNFLANEWDKARAAKRGGDRQRLSLDWDQGESRLSVEPQHELTAEREFERQWVWTLLEVVVNRLHQEFLDSDKSRQFDLLKEALSGDRQAIDYPAVSAELGMSEDAVRQAASRLRKRYRELLRDEVAQTVTDPAEIEDELRGLFTALGA